ncbi:hypothetical protein [Streptomyces sp. NPDC051219]|uniref:hypothetical protein n=1 Tax=Streptomyces sp. NPDC051219 TaxID=3155283 RepID=UPI0034219BC8
MPSQAAEPSNEQRFPPTGAEGAEAMDGESMQTLLWTAATRRPVEEVAALVTLLRRTGEIRNAGDEALRAAAVTRPVDEVMKLVALLNAQPDEGDDAGTALRAAAVGRPIEEVAQLVSVLGAEEEYGPAPDCVTAGQPDASGDRSSPGGPITPAGPSMPGGPISPGGPGSPGGPITPAGPSMPGGPVSPVGPGPGRPVGPVGAISPVGPISRTSAPAVLGERRGATPVLADSTAGRQPAPALQSVLRLPAAAALFGCGVIHLPTDLGDLRSGGYADAVSLAITVCCLVLGVWLALQDTAPVWAATASTTVGIIVVHGLSGLGVISLPESSLGAAFAWASVVAVLLAAAGAALAGYTLLAHQRTAGTTTRLR